MTVQTQLQLSQVTLGYDDTLVVEGVNLSLEKGQIGCLLGSSGCGKSTLLRAIAGFENIWDGEILMKGEMVSSAQHTRSPEKRRVGMVFQRPNPFPKSIYENVVYGLRLQGVSNSRDLDDAVERSLRAAALWDEVKDRLHENAFGLSGGQQQRLVIARAVAIEPEVLLLDEPTSALDPISTLTIEELINDLKTQYTVVIVTHNMQQAARVSDHTAFIHMGKLIEYSDTDSIFTSPLKNQTEDYITGRYG